MFAHPDLIIDAPAEHFGMRARVRPSRTEGLGMQPKYTFKEIRRAIDRTQGAWSAWAAPQERAVNAAGGRNGAVFLRMPQPLSAYMALLDDAHPHYELQYRVRLKEGQTLPSCVGTPFPKAPARLAPLLMSATDEARAARYRYQDQIRLNYDTARAAFDKRMSDYATLRHEFNLDEMQIEEAFGWYCKGNRQHSVPRLALDGVHWNLIRLMCGDHPEIVVVPTPAADSVTAG